MRLVPDGTETQWASWLLDFNALSTVQSHPMTSTRRDLDTVGLVRNGEELTHGLGQMGQVYTGTGTQWDWYTMGKSIHMDLDKWDRHTLELGHIGTGTQWKRVYTWTWTIWDRYTLGLGHSRTGT